MKFGKIITVVLLSTTKFFLAPPIAASLGFSFWQIFTYCSLGGVVGVLVYTFLSDQIIKLYFWLLLFFFKKEQPKGVKFGKTSRLMVKLKQKGGLWAIAFLTPVLFSIPAGVFLTSRYFNVNQSIVAQSVAVFFWSLFFAFLYSGIFSMF